MANAPVQVRTPQEQDDQSALARSLRPNDLTGGFYLAFASLATGLAIALSLRTGFWGWLVGQALLALVMIQWFAILHEAGHKTLFRTRWLNRLAAHGAGFAALIPADCWRIVHAKHHYWTGWQDLDMTTESLVPRPLRFWERLGINLCWTLWIPLFATLYRVNNYWNLPRLWRLFPRNRERRQITANLALYAAAYATLAWSLGWETTLRCFGLATLVTLSLQDLIILSQHTHIPMTLSEGAEVDPYPPEKQDVFTRSLVFPSWFARLVLLNMDAHGLHHTHPSVPGYHLHRLEPIQRNATHWWHWVVHAKSVRGDVLLFQNRDSTGLYF